LNKKRLSIILGIATLAIICTTVAAQMIASFTTTHQLSIKGIGLDVLEWVSDTTTPTTLFESCDWGTLNPEETGNSINIVLYGSGTEPTTLDFTNTLNVSVGSIKWEIEGYTGGGGGIWNWYNWQGALESGTPVIGETYAPGTPENPLAAGEYIGMRPSAPVVGDFGRVRLSLTVDASAPMGPVSAFTTTATATEIV